MGGRWEEGGGREEGGRRGRTRVGVRELEGRKLEEEGGRRYMRE